MKLSRVGSVEIFDVFTIFYAYPFRSKLISYSYYYKFVVPGPMLLSALPMNSPISPQWVAIHQPNFFPWLGYFDKIRRCDFFILMDRVAYPKSGSGSGSWTNRVKLNIQGNAQWIGAPIQRASGIQLIQDVLIEDKQPWRKKMLKTLEMNYKKAPNYEAIMTLIEPLILYDTPYLAELNIHAITKLSEAVGLTTPMIRQSTLPPSGEASTSLLIKLVQQVGGQGYLCGGGASGYQEDELFEQAGLALKYQSYAPNPYGSLAENDFLPGLSIIDFLMYEEPSRYSLLGSPMHQDSPV